MKVQAEISIYPLRQNELTEPIQQFIRALKNHNLIIKTGGISTFVAGDSQVIFESLQQAFEQIAERYEVVMNAKISNACPEFNRDGRSFKE
jgi:uncharacterized protein YqgV (UPF0045/DUF77 family)